MKIKGFCVRVQNCCTIMAPPACLEPMTLRQLKLRTCGRSSEHIQPTLAVPGISLPGGIGDTSRWHQRIFHRDYRPRKTRVPAVRSRCLLLPPAAAARSPVNSRRSLRTRAVGLSQEKQTKEKADYRMVVCFSLAPPVGLEPTTLRLTAACSAD